MAFIDRNIWIGDHHGLDRVPLLWLGRPLGITPLMVQVGSLTVPSEHRYWLCEQRVTTTVTAYYQRSDNFGQANCLKQVWNCHPLTKCAAFTLNTRQSIWLLSVCGQLVHP